MNKNQWLDQVQHLLRQDPHKSEARRVAISRSARVLDAELEGKAFIDDPEVLEARAMLAAAARDFARADELWCRLGTIAPDSSDRALLEAAKCSFAIGDLKTVRQRLNAINEPNNLGSNYTSLRTEFERRTRLVESNEQYFLARSALLSGDDRGYVANAGIALEKLLGETPSSGSQLLLQEIAAFVANKATPVDDRARRSSLYSGRENDSDRSAALFCVGFGYSGSGAVFDYLRQSAQCIPFSTQELNLVTNGTPSVADVLDASTKHGVAESCCIVEPFRIVLHDWLVQAVFGFAKPEVKYVYQDNARRRALVSALPKMRESIEDSTLDFLIDCRHLIDSGLSPELAFRQSFADYFSRLVSLRCNTKKFALFNNVVRGRDLRHFSVLPSDAVAIAVFRNPVDAYVDRFSWGAGMRVSKFIADWRSSIERFREVMQQPALRGRVIPVQFEDFVRDEQVRLNLLGKLGLDAESITEKVHFVPEESERNIGIADEFQDREALIQIEKQMQNLEWSN